MKKNTQAQAFRDIIESYIKEHDDPNDPYLSDYHFEEDDDKVSFLFDGTLYELLNYGLDLSEFGGGIDYTFRNGLRDALKDIYWEPYNYYRWDFYKINEGMEKGCHGEDMKKTDDEWVEDPYDGVFYKEDGTDYKGYHLVQMKNVDEDDPESIKWTGYNDEGDPVSVMGYFDSKEQMMRWMDTYITEDEDLEKSDTRKGETKIPVSEDDTVEIEEMDGKRYVEIEPKEEHAEEVSTGYEEADDDLNTEDNVTHPDTSKPKKSKKSKTEKGSIPFTVIQYREIPDSVTVRGIDVPLKYNGGEFCEYQSGEGDSEVYIVAELTSGEVRGRFGKFDQNALVVERFDKNNGYMLAEAIGKVVDRLNSNIGKTKKSKTNKGKSPRAIGMDLINEGIEVLDVKDYGSDFEIFVPESHVSHAIGLLPVDAQVLEVIPYKGDKAIIRIAKSKTKKSSMIDFYRGTVVGDEYISPEGLVLTVTDKDEPFVPDQGDDAELISYVLSDGTSGRKTWYALKQYFVENDFVQKSKTKKSLIDFTEGMTLKEFFDANKRGGDSIHGFDLYSVRLDGEQVGTNYTGVESYADYIVDSYEMDDILGLMDINIHKSLRPSAPLSPKQAYKSCGRYQRDHGLIGLSEKEIEEITGRDAKKFIKSALNDGIIKPIHCKDGTYYKFNTMM